MSTAALQPESDAAREQLIARGWDALPASYRIPDKTPTIEEARVWCKHLAETHYENFHVATWFLPERLRPHFHAIYAYCRVSDDLGDEVGNTEQSLALLDLWGRELDACYGHPVEAVLMRYRDGRRSVCISSQSGCPLTCSFCATGQMQFRRNLTPSEILDQALHFRRVEAIDHVVFMGMGEPMLNVDAVIAAARRLPDLGVTHRRTTISTVGWLPGLRRFVDEVEEPIRLALSLHAPADALRSEIMPVNDRYPLDEVLAECRRYFDLRGRKVFVEYVMLAGVNDSPEHAHELADLLDRHVFKVNLIPYNPTGMYDGSSRESIAAFKAVLDAARLPATVRLTRGRDIAAACGQLAATA